MSLPDEIQILTTAEGIRARSELYVPRGVNVRNFLALEAMCLALAEAHCGSCTRIKVKLAGRTAIIEDDGMGLSVQPDRSGTSLAEKMLTRLYACRDHKAHRAMAHELCGAGIVAVNALSESFVVRTRADGAEHELRFARGEMQGGLTRLGDTEEKGTIICFTLDPDFAGTEPFDATALLTVVHSKPIDLTRTSIDITED